MIILRDYQDILWTKSLSGGCEYCEANQGRPLQLTDFFNILRPQNIEIEGRKFWAYKHGPIELVIMRTRHFPDTAISVDESQWCSGVFINRKVWISGDTMFDADYPIRFGRLAEVMFHDTQLFFGGVHASYQELITLPEDVRAKMFHIITETIGISRKPGLAGRINIPVIRLKTDFWVGLNNTPPTIFTDLYIGIGKNKLRESLYRELPDYFEYLVGSR
jgi:hypothetical protein